MRPKTSVPFFAVLVACMLTAEHGYAALDLTGTWQGTWSCQDVTSGAVTKPKNTLTMAVTQSGGDVHAFITWDGSNTYDTFQGHVQELTGKPGDGAATIITCATRAGSTEYAEMLSGMAKVRPTNAKPENATFKGTSTYELAAAPTVGGVCKYSLKRVSLANPGIAACPVPAVCGNGTIESPETCEVGNLNGKTCQTQGFAGGTLGCAAGCTLDTSGCWATRFVDNGNGTVTDNQTNLVWEKKTTTVNSGANLADPHDVDNSYSWGSGIAPYPPNGTAFTDFIARLNGSADGVCFAGQCDWRLPTLAELQGIVDLAAPGCVAGSPCISGVLGPTHATLYWSSSTSAFDPGDAWVVDFYDGFTAGDFKINLNNSVRAVRGGS